MRLNAEQRQRICRLTHEQFGERVRVQLFGSRLDDAAHGGDVDLLLLAQAPVSLAQKVDLGWRLEQELGLSVDIVVIDHQGQLIETSGLREDAVKALGDAKKPLA